MRPRPECFVAKGDVRAASHSGDRQLLNVLSPEEFRGDEYRYGRPGRIPRSVNLPYPELLDSSGRVVPPETTRKLLDELSVDPQRPLITYCGGGLAAAFVAMVLTVAGNNDVSVYDGSMLEWSADPDLPLETG